MITEMILNGFQILVNAALFLVPPIPAMPDPIQNATSNIIDLINDMVGVVAYIYTPAITVFMFTVILAILGFDFIYKFVLWILHKVRG